ncbi:MAG TPA: DUF998 domain-containing protein [Streptosporangiaceae bacterium]|nr:DUF998 domain-containing protein [Streptosporangiaceae bacterium]
MKAAHADTAAEGAENGAELALRGVPWWGIASSAAAPVLLVAGWAAAAAVQSASPRPYDWVRQTVSVLAAPGATDRWVMTLTFVLVGTCDVVTGLALRPAARAGRLMLIIGAAGGILVAANPEPAGGGSSARHAFFATIGFVALTVWPIAAVHWQATRPGPATPWALRPAVAVGAAWVTAALLTWFVVELLIGLPQLGLSERALGEFQALWPLVAVVSCVSAHERAVL